MTARIIFLFLLLSLNVLNASEQEHSYAVVTAHKLATLAGEEILQAGGNAFDASVAISAVLAVVEPYSSGLGGGGFWLLHDAEEDLDIVIDGRELAPLAATHDMYLDKQGKLTRQSIDGPLAAGIPGVVAALEFIVNHHGKLSLSENFQPAIRVAKQGFKPSDHYLKHIKFRQQALLDSGDARNIFFDNGAIPGRNFIIRQQDLAVTLEEIAKHGAKVFYQGEIAQKLVAEVKKAGGIWTLQDLNQYQVQQRVPIKTKFHDIEITMPPPPTSGGVVITQILAMLEDIELENLDDVQVIHTIVEAMRRAYQDRAVFLGDPEFVNIPMQRLLNHQYAKDKFANFNKDSATSSAQLPNPTLGKGEDTTHFSVLDAEGNHVAATLSINYPFGSGFVVPGTGILLNDEMDDFSMGEGVANIWGLVGSHANAIEPGKRMLSSMTPLFARNKSRMLIVGTPGGSRIISMLALALIKYKQGANSQQIVRERRFHHQYLPDEIQFEKNAFSELEKSLLVDKGHQLKELSRTYGNMHAIIWDKDANKLEASADPRGEGLAIVH